MQKEIIKLFWRYSRHSRTLQTLALLFPAVAVSINAIAAPYVLSLFLDKLQGGNITLENSWLLIATYAVLIFSGEVIAWRLALYFTWTFEINGMRNLYLAIFQS